MKTQLSVTCIKRLARHFSRKYFFKGRNSGLPKIEGEGGGGGLETVLCLCVCFFELIIAHLKGGKAMYMYVTVLFTGGLRTTCTCTI